MNFRFLKVFPEKYFILSFLKKKKSRKIIRLKENLSQQLKEEGFLYDEVKITFTTELVLKRNENEICFYTFFFFFVGGKTAFFFFSFQQSKQWNGHEN